MGVLCPTSFGSYVTWGNCTSIAASGVVSRAGGFTCIQKRTTSTAAASAAKSPKTRHAAIFAFFILVPSSRFECAVQERQRHIHPVVHIRMVVVELLVAMVDARLVQALGEDARAVVDVVLVAPAAIHVDTTQRLQVRAVLRDQVHRVVVAPALPALGNQFAGLEVEGQAESVGSLRVRIIGGR